MQSTQPAKVSKPGRKTLAGLVGVAAAAMLFHLVPTNEGRVLKTYKDIGGVLTYCDGATENAAWDRVYTPDQCNAQLERDLVRHAKGVLGCVHRPLTDGQLVAFVDTAYNVGVANFCGSSMAREANAGHVQASCDAVLAWNKITIGHVKTPDGRFVPLLREVPGLTARRERARSICVKY